MTPKQEERIKNKIKKIKAALAADKRYWGGAHHDGPNIFLDIQKKLDTESDREIRGYLIQREKQLLDEL